MVTSKAATVEQYLESLEPDRRDTVIALRKLLKKHVPSGFEETMLYGMISYVVPLSVYPDTYNGQPLTLVSLASQKNALSLYLVGAYASDEVRKRFETASKNAGKKLDMGKSCVRFKDLDGLSLEAVAEAVSSISLEQYIELANKAHPKPKKTASAKKSAKKATAPKTPRKR